MKFNLQAVLAWIVASQNLCMAVRDDAAEASLPYLVPLRRESVPVRRHGKIASFKTSYSGVISVGSPQRQEFRVVFDTGSGHVVLPALECGSESCLLHRRYNMAASESAVMVDLDGAPVAPGEYADQATIGFGTGEITGEFTKDRVCLGPADNEPSEGSEAQANAPCLDVAMITAIEMSAQPFKTFAFDGILGLGLSSLALSPSFSLLDVFTKSGSAHSSYFAFYLTESDEGADTSEVALGGYNKKRLLEPLAWSPAAKADLGYWQVRILAVRINGEEMDVCRDGTCHGVVDTGSSHLGVPAPHDKEFAELLTQDAMDILDCRLADAPTLEIELPGANLSILPETYMRRLPLREGVNVGSAKGVSMMHSDAKQAEGDRMSDIAAASSLRGSGANSTDNLNVSQNASATESDPALPQKVKRHCRPKMMPVTMPAPLGPKLFILGEPVLHRYYTVYDWSALRIGFGLAANQHNLLGPLASRPGADRRGSLPDGMDTILMQQRLDLVAGSSVGVSHGWSDSESDDVVFAQVSLTVIFGTRL
jgi:hypothetical protein